MAVRKPFRVVLGWTIIVLGIISLPTPLPGILIIMGGFAVLGVNKKKFLRLLFNIIRWKKKI